MHGDEIARFFGAADADSGGSIDLGEFRAAVSDMKLGLLDGEANALFAGADHDGNGVLDLDEFAELVATCRPLLENFGDVLKVAAEKHRRAEEKLLATLFRPDAEARGCAPRSRRPSLANLRTTQDVLVSLRVDQWWWRTRRSVVAYTL